MPAATGETAQAGWTAEETVARLSLAEKYLSPKNSPGDALRPLIAGLHLLNVQQTFRDQNGK